MKKEDLPVLAFDTQVEAEEAFLSLTHVGFDVGKLSLVGKNHDTDGHPVGFFAAGSKIKNWGRVSAYWAGIRSLPLAPVVFFLPGVGSMTMAGPVVSALAGALDGAVAMRGVSAIGTALTQTGVPQCQVIAYEAALEADKYVIIVHGNSDEVAAAHSTLGQRTRNA